MQITNHFLDLKLLIEYHLKLNLTLYIVFAMDSLFCVFTEKQIVTNILSERNKLSIHSITCTDFLTANKIISKTNDKHSNVQFRLTLSVDPSHLIYPLNFVPDLLFLW